MHEPKSADYWDKISQHYIGTDDPYLARYHAARLRAACELLDGHGGRLFDFGCGSGELFGFLQNFNKMEGCDIAPAMIELAQRNYPQVQTEVGGVEVFKRKTGPYGVVVALNVLPYLGEDDEAEFFSHARKVSKYVLASHVNELFDLTTFNRYTIDFFRRNCLDTIEVDREAAIAGLAGLLTDVGGSSDRDEVPKRVANPLTYSRPGFTLLEMRCINQHPLPPSVLDMNPAWRLAQPDVRMPPPLDKLFCSQFQVLLRAS